MEFYWEGIQYNFTVKYSNGHIVTLTTYSEEGLSDAIKKYGDQIVSFEKVTKGKVVED